MMKHSATDILEYMQRQYAKSCPLGVYLLDYFISQGLLSISEVGGRITGVIIYRKVKLSRYDERDKLSNYPKGDCAFVVELCADTKNDIAILENQMRKRLGKCRYIGMHRRGKAKFYNYDKYINQLLGKDKL